MTSWHLQRFEDRLDTWAEREQPNDHLRLTVAAWVLSRFDDPYQGVRREPGFDNLWFGIVPRTRHANAQVIVCSYWIQEQAHLVVCDQLGSLPLPIL